MRRKEQKLYYVGRAQYYYGGFAAVEVSVGRDSANPGTLVAKWEAETDYEDPREAVRAAISIRNWWQRDGSSDTWPYSTEGCELIQLTHIGSFAGEMGIEAEPTTETEMREWAEKQYTAIPKCDGCGYPLGNDPLHDYDNHYCSNYCFEEANNEPEYEYEAEADMEEWRTYA